MQSFRASDDDECENNILISVILKLTFYDISTRQMYIQLNYSLLNKNLKFLVSRATTSVTLYFSQTGGRFQYEIISTLPESSL